jgi:hypothetical protein
VTPTIPPPADPSRARWDAWRELLNTHGNAFLIGAAGGDRGTVVMGCDLLARPLLRAEVANLIAWLLMVSGVTAPELEAVCQAQGFPLRSVLGVDIPGDPLQAVQAGDQVEVLGESGRWLPAKFIRWEADGLAAVVDMGDGFDPAHGNQGCVGRTNLRVPA